MNSHFRTRVMQQKIRAFSMLFFWREILEFLHGRLARELKV
jgi:hypothetical protein